MAIKESSEGKILFDGFSTFTDRVEATSQEYLETRWKEYSISDPEIQEKYQEFLQRQEENEKIPLGFLEEPEEEVVELVDFEIDETKPRMIAESWLNSIRTVHPGEPEEEKEGEEEVEPDNEEGEEVSE